MPSRKPIRRHPQATSPDTCRPSPHSSAASWGVKARSCPTSPRRSRMAVSPRAASNALRDGSTTSASWRRCIFYRMPRAWRVRQGPKGHFPEDLHIAVVELMREVIPEGATVVFLGDGEFDGTTLQATLNEAGWSYACRTALSTVATWEGVTFRRDTLGTCSKPGTLIELKEVQFPRDAYGPVMVLSCWAKGYQDPLYLVSNMDAAEEACRYYQKRFRIETFFSDQKSRGFHLHKSHISDPQRLSRLLIAACLAYIWIVSLGSLCEKEGWRNIIHRSDRCDVSLFQLGLRLLEHFLNEDIPILVQFHVNI